MASSEVSSLIPPISTMPNPVDDRSKLIHDSLAWVGHAMRRVRSRYDGADHEIEIDGIGSFVVSGNGLAIALLHKQEAIEDVLLIEAVLGPALILALSIRGVFSLHASAVTLGDGVILFLGDSGAGKSTMARMLQNTRASIHRLTDDISPFVSREGRFELLPEFPQLKLTASQQCAGGHHKSAEISAIYQLHRADPGQVLHPLVSRERLSPIESFRALVGQGVASRLFPPELLRKHTRQVAALCEAVPVYRLSYPDGMEYVAAVRSFLLTH